MLRGTGSLFAILAVTLFFSAVISAALALGARKTAETWQRAWARALARIAGVRIEAEGAERFGGYAPCVVAANHRSHFDLVAVFAALYPPPFAVAKRTLFRIPVFGWAMAWMGHIPLDRKNARSARKSLDKARASLRKGRSVLMFPEGTRRREADGRLQPFHAGAFRLAVEAGAPVLPVAIVGGEKTLPPNSLAVRPAGMRLVVGEPLASEGKDPQDLSRETRKAIEALLRHAEDEG